MVIVGTGWSGKVGTCLGTSASVDGFVNAAPQVKPRKPSRNGVQMAIYADIVQATQLEVAQVVIRVD